MEKMKRTIIIVLDGVGVGALPDAADYGDQGSDTLGNLARHMKGLKLPNLQRWGLGNIVPTEGIAQAEDPISSYGRMAEKSPGKDSTSGHWELVSCPLEKGFPVYPDGFPPEVMKLFAEVAKIVPLGNIAASGTEIIEELAQKHLETKKPIVYTSADSVFQVAAHVNVWSVEQLHAVCAAMRERLVPPHQVARVIARPFFGEPGNLVRSPERKDFTIPPPEPTVLDMAKAAGYDVVGVGKIGDLFAEQGLTRSRPAKGMDICLEEILEALDQHNSGIIIANLGDFDTLWGHRNDPEGFSEGLEQFDAWLPDLEEQLRPETDIVVITADHGCDPTTSSTDHSREYVPLLVWNGGVPGVDLGTRKTFADVGATVAEFLQLEDDVPGDSFLSSLPQYYRPEEEAAPEEEEETGKDASEEGDKEEEKPEIDSLFFDVLRQESDIPPAELKEFWQRQQEQLSFAGNLLVAVGKLSHEQLEECVGLALARWLDQADLLKDDVKACFDARAEEQFWGEVLVDEGLVSEEELARFYVRACGIPYLQLSDYKIPREAFAALPREAAVSAGVLPIEKVDDQITVATSRPADSRLVEEVAEQTGCRVRTVLAMRDQLLEALGNAYSAQPDTPDVTEHAARVPSKGHETTAQVPDGKEHEGRKATPEQVELEWLLHTARAMVRNAYAPHSNLHVGAAALADNGEVFSGCNVENDSYGLSICAERVAIFKAVCGGRRRIKALAVVCDEIKGIRPCGACLQVIKQFGPETQLVFEAKGGGADVVSIDELLPQAFSLQKGDT